MSRTHALILAVGFLVVGGVVASLATAQPAPAQKPSPQYRAVLATEKGDLAGKEGQFHDSMLDEWAKAGWTLVAIEPGIPNPKFNNEFGQMPYLRGPRFTFRNDNPVR